MGDAEVLGRRSSAERDESARWWTDTEATRCWWASPEGNLIQTHISLPGGPKPRFDPPMVGAASAEQSEQEESQEVRTDLKIEDRKDSSCLF